MTGDLDSLRLQARALPELPGVYFWVDKADKVLYVGKAVNLRARVMSYFSRARTESRTRSLVTRSSTIKHEVSATELEALFRESALIKRLQPPFNRALRTPHKSFYFKLDAAQADPYLEATREVEDDGSLYLGPFRTGRVMRETMQFVHSVLPLRKCAAMNPRCRPCIYHQMGTCAAPLLDEEHRRRHQEAIDQLQDLLDGRTDRVLSWLEAKRDRLSDSLLYERAAEIQERIEGLQQSQARQAMLDAAVQSRCVLVHSSDRRDDEDRLLLVAHGQVVSVRAAEGALPSEVARWVRVHEPIIRSLKDRERPIDASMVLERWLVRNRATTRWVAIPHRADDADLLDRVAYVLGAVPVPA